MFSIIKKITVAAFVVTILVPAITSAKVYHINKYDQKKFVGDHKSNEHSVEEKEVECAVRGLYNAEEAMAVFGVSNISQIPKENGVSVCQAIDSKCYKCSCPKSYQFTCEKYGLKLDPTAGKCTLRKSQTFYSGCACDTEAGYVPESSLNTAALSKFNTVEPVKPISLYGGENIKCYNYSAFSNCSNTSAKMITRDIVKKFNSSSDINNIKLHINGEQYVEYIAISLKKNGTASDNKYCPTAIIGENPLMSTQPDTECTKTGTYTASKYNKTFFYYSDCSTSDFCSSSSNDCVETSSNTKIDVYNPGDDSKSSLTCYKMTGCKNGLVTTADGQKQIFCKEVNGYGDMEKGFLFDTERVSTTAGQKFCSRISCSTGWTQTPTDINQYSPIKDYTSDAPIKYDARKVSAGGNTMVCRQAVGCLKDDGYYNYACQATTSGEELCWGGWLSLWAKAAGK